MDFKNLDGINDTNKKYKELNIESQNLNDIKSDFFITGNKEEKNTRNKINENYDEKIKLVKDIIDSSFDNDVFDGYVVKNKRYTTVELINKISSKENSYSFEKNKLCKRPFPLLKFISSRKCKNNSNRLMANILLRERDILLKNQKNMIKHKFFNKTQQNMIYKKFPIINTKSHSISNNIDNNKANNLYFFEHYMNNSNNNKYIKTYQNNSFTKNKEIKDYNIRFKNIRKIKNTFNNGTVFNISKNNNDSNINNCDNLMENNQSKDIISNVKLKNNNIAKFANKSISLESHNAISNNIEIINKRKFRINNLNNYSKNIQLFRPFDNIIKYISNQKVNKNLTKFKGDFKLI